LEGDDVTTLGRKELQEAVDDADLDRRLVITPLLDPKQVGRGAVDLRLGTEFLVLRRTRHAGIDPSVRVRMT
jgi:dCTP deaminase